VPFVTNEKGFVVVVIVRGVNGSKACVVVIVSLGLEPIGKGMVEGGKKHLLHTIALCVSKYEKIFNGVNDLSI
jgi:hypothetical protein